MLGGAKPSKVNSAAVDRNQSVCLVFFGRRRAPLGIAAGRALRRIRRIVVIVVNDADDGEPVEE